MYKVFDTLEEYNQFTNDGANLTAGVIYYVNEDGSTHFQTNNIDGEEKVYDMIDGIPEGYIVPSGNISITENGENINVNEYATASVNVPIPEGYIVPSGNKEITQNGTNIDIAQYATASVAVPQPSGNISITANGENIDVAQYATATVNVPSGTEDVINLIERDFTTFNIPYGTTKIGDNAFNYYRNLTGVTIPNSVTSINYSAFNGCSSLTSVTIPDSVTYIGNYAFGYCSSLTSVTIPNSVTSIGSEAFYNCSGLTSVTIGNSVTSIGSEAFKNCSGLTSVTIPNSVTEIGTYAFYGCTSLTSVIVPNYIPSLGDDVFDGCTSLPVENYVKYAGTWALQNDRNQTSYTLRQDTTYLVKTFYYCTEITSVGEIGSGASVEIPNSVVAISNYAFYGCTGLTSVTIPNSVTYIGNNIFYNSTGLTSITINATTPPTLANTYAFNNTNNCPIYVPAESVDAYKTATNWSSYASRIQPIPTE